MASLTGSLAGRHRQISAQNCVDAENGISNLGHFGSLNLVPRPRIALGSIRLKGGSNSCYTSAALLVGGLGNAPSESVFETDLSSIAATAHIGRPGRARTGSFPLRTRVFVLSNCGT